MTPSSTLCINGCHLSWLCLIYGHFSSFMFFPFFSGCYWDFGCTINWTWDFIHFAWPATDIKGYRKTKDIFNAFNIVMSFSQFSFPTLVYVKCITGQPFNSKEQYLLMHKKLRLNWHKVLYCSPLYRSDSQKFELDWTYHLYHSCEFQQIFEWWSFGNVHI